MTDPVYLDWNATAVPRPESVAAVARAAARVGNPSSVHGPGRLARQTVEAARAQVAAAVGARPQEVIFLSGGTEANTLALCQPAWRSIVVSAVEHDSVRAAAGATGLPVHVVGVDENGVVRLDALAETLADSTPPVLVSLMLANNETGVIQPVAEAARIAHAHGATVHCDAVQALGKIPVDRDGLDVDLMSLSAHKIGGPTGVGALVVRDGLAVQPAIVGGGQELGRRSGTENGPGIAGFGVAAESAVAELDDAGRLAALRDDLEARIARVAPQTRFFSARAERLANTSCLSMAGVPAETQVMALDLTGVCVSSGSACSSGKVRASHVLAAVGAGDAEAGEAIRVSLGRTTTPGDIDRFVDAWSTLYERTAAKRGRPLEAV